MDWEGFSPDEVNLLSTRAKRRVALMNAKCEACGVGDVSIQEPLV